MRESIFIYVDYYDGDYDDDPEYKQHKREEKISEIVDEWKKNIIPLAEDKWLNGKDLFQCDMILKHEFNNDVIIVFGINTSEDEPHTVLNYMSLEKISDNYLWNNDFVIKGNVYSAKDIVDNIIEFDNIQVDGNKFNPYLANKVKQNNEILN